MARGWDGVTRRGVMAHQYNSFLLRHWRLDGARDRIEVEHIQAGTHHHATSLAAALAWIAAAGADPARADEPSPADTASDRSPGTGDARRA